MLTASKELAQYFETTVAHTNNPKLTTNWVMGELSAALNKDSLSISESPINAEHLGQLITRIADNTISGKIAKTVFEFMWTTGDAPDLIIEKQGLKQVTDTGAIEKIIDEVIANNPEQLADYKNGKDKLFSFFVGQVMKLSKGKANPNQVNELLKEKL